MIPFRLSTPLALGCILLLGGCSKEKLPPVPEKRSETIPCSNMASWGFPQRVFPAEINAKMRKKNFSSLGFLCRPDRFVLGYDTQLWAPRWVLEKTDKKNLEGNEATNHRDWRPDPFVPSQSRVLPEYYSKKYTQDQLRILQLASSKNVKNDEIKVSHTYYLSNSLPFIFVNKDPTAWGRLEDSVVKWTKDKSQLLVISGPLYANGMSLGWAGPMKEKRRSTDPDQRTIAIPTHFYKVIVDEKGKSGIAFIVPNSTAPAQDLPSMAKTIQYVEGQAGLNLFPEMSAEDRAKITNQVNARNWPLVN
jgi:DNA/RNA endonuclease G (NUC1)